MVGSDFSAPGNRGIAKISQNIFGKKEVMNIALIKVGPDEPLEKAIKRFKRLIEKEGIIREWRRREYFEKPSLIRSRRRKALIRKQLRKERLEARKWRHNR